VREALANPLNHEVSPVLLRTVRIELRVGAHRRIVKL
jgi:hypothetical protein